MDIKYVKKGKKSQTFMKTISAIPETYPEISGDHVTSLLVYRNHNNALSIN